MVNSLKRAGTALVTIVLYNGIDLTAGFQPIRDAYTATRALVIPSGGDDLITKVLEGATSYPIETATLVAVPAVMAATGAAYKKVMKKR